MFQLELECGHRVFTDIKLMHPKGTVAHHVFCPPCREAKEMASPKKPYPLCWTRVINSESVSSMPIGAVRIMPKDIMRLQEGIARNRIRPFPYIRLNRTDAGITRPSGRE